MFRMPFDLLRKRFRAAAPALVLLAGAGAASAKPLKVVTTTTDLAAVAREIGGRHAKVQSLAKGVMNPHFVDAKPSLILKVMRADVYAEIGLELEIGWAPLLLRGSRNKHVMPGGRGYIDASTAVEPLEIPRGEVSRAMGDVHAGGNPHYMVDPDRARLVADLFAKRFAALRPEHAEEFRGNLAAFEKKLDAKTKEWDAALAPAKGAKILVYHKNWSYLENRWQLERVGEIEPKPGIPPTASHTARLLEIMKSGDVRGILTEPWFEKRTPASIAKQSGARVLDMALLPDARDGAGPDYFSWMDYNVRILREGLVSVER
jgi:ABC-type Zn uptake system ZnuABC Zn-binding protein ZnuA